MGGILGRLWWGLEKKIHRIFPANNQNKICNRSSIRRIYKAKKIKKELENLALENQLIE